MQEYERVEKRNNFIKLVLSNYGLNDSKNVRTQEQIRNLTSRHKVKLTRFDHNWEDML